MKLILQLDVNLSPREIDELGTFFRDAFGEFQSRRGFGPAETHETNCHRVQQYVLRQYPWMPEGHRRDKTNQVMRRCEIASAMKRADIAWVYDD